MTIQNAPIYQTILATANLTATQFKAITAGGTIAATSAVTVGLLQNKPNSGQHAQVAVSGILKGYAGAAVGSAGAAIKVTTSGFITPTSAGDSGVVGKSMETANSGDLVSFLADFAAAV